MSHSVNIFNFFSKQSYKHMRRVDTFIHTYLRCFEDKDQLRVQRMNNLVRFSQTLVQGPVSFIGALNFPYTSFYPEFYQLAYIWQGPWVVMAYFLLRYCSKFSHMLLAHKSKNKLYKKYSPSMELTKEQIEELEAELEEQGKLE